MRPFYYWLTAALLGLGIILAIGLRWINHEQVQALKLDVVNLALQLMVVGIVGGLIKSALDQQKAAAEFRIEVVTELGRAHSTTYALRRTLALRGHEPEVVRECMFELMRVRNELGSVGHNARVRLDASQVMASIRVIRAYLEELINEAMSEARDGEMKMGPKLHMFVAGCTGQTDEATAYRHRFKAPYIQAKVAADPTWVLDEEQQHTLALLHAKESVPTPAATHE